MTCFKNRNNCFNYNYLLLLLLLLLLLSLLLSLLLFIYLFIYLFMQHGQQKYTLEVYSK